jgi:hypothetical protein
MLVNDAYSEVDSGEASVGTILRLGFPRKEEGRAPDEAEQRPRRSTEEDRRELRAVRIPPTFATLFSEAVGDPIALSAILSHANLKTVMKYCHPRESHTAKAMERYVESMTPKVVEEKKAQAAVN